MTPEELNELRKSAEMVQRIGIQNAAICEHPYNGVNNASFALVNLPDLLAHIDSQAAQIAALKEMLVEERARYLALENNLMWGPLPDQNTPDKLYPAHIIRGRIHWRDMARQQLKADPDLQGVTWDE